MKLEGMRNENVHVLSILGLLLLSDAIDIIASHLRLLGGTETTESHHGLHLLLHVVLVQVCCWSCLILSVVLDLQSLAIRVAAARFDAAYGDVLSVVTDDFMRRRCRTSS